MIIPSTLYLTLVDEHHSLTYNEAITDSVVEQCALLKPLLYPVVLFC